jgi:hypothetical protein
MKRVITATAASFALFLGGMIYVLWRNESLIMFRWFDVLGFGGQVHCLRIYAKPYVNILPQWVIFSLPQALWLFSGILLLKSIWGNDKHKRILFWSVILLTIAFGIEYGQYLHWIPGTFDELDIGLLIAGYTVSVAFIELIYDRERRT